MKLPAIFAACALMFTCCTSNSNRYDNSDYEYSDDFSEIDEYETEETSADDMNSYRARIDDLLDQYESVINRIAERLDYALDAKMLRHDVNELNELNRSLNNEYDNARTTDEQNARYEQLALRNDQVAYLYNCKFGLGSSDNGFYPSDGASD